MIHLDAFLFIFVILLCSIPLHRGKNLYHCLPIQKIQIVSLDSIEQTKLKIHYVLL